MYKNNQLTITKLSSEKEIEESAEIMCSTEPWISLGRTYDIAIANLSDPNKEVYIIRSNSEYAGFMIINMQGAFIGYIQTICIKSDYRRKGIGTKLIEFAEQRILKESPNIFICVSSFNKEAQNLYFRLGYEKIGELNNYIINGHSEILLRKTIGCWNDFNKPD